MRSDQRHEPIAILGMGCRFPGNADSPEKLWQLLVDGRDAVGPAPPGRVQAGAFGPPVGGYLEDIAGFDAAFFGISGGEADALDPQHRLLLEVSWQALEHAGLLPEQLAGTDTGIFTGLSYDEYAQREVADRAGSVLVNGHCVAPGRISYLLGLHGPSVALDTACSSSLVALHLACQALRAGDCELALAGGVTVMLSTVTSTSFERMNMLSGTGQCHTFDAGADGFVRGEGCGVVVLKRLADADRDGDRVLAVIRGSAVNQDGASDGLAAPSRSAQVSLYRAALNSAGLDPEQIGLIETHGTGTPVGDPVEFGSVLEVYGAGAGRCALGSVKTNLGHLEPAAGISGLIKAVLCLQHDQIPANLHFQQWNPAIPADRGRLFVPTSLASWPARELDQPRRAAVSSFGFSGTNAHVILEQAPSPATPIEAGSIDEPTVFLVPAGSEQVLPTAAGRLADWVEGPGRAAGIEDIAHTLALHRSPGRGRLAVVARSRDELATELRAFAAGQVSARAVSNWVGAGVRRSSVWVFSGQGSQWAGMGQGLLRHEPAFAATLTELDGLIAAEAGFSVLEIVRSGAEVTGPGRVQPTLFAMQLALAATWRAHGVEPAAVVGHSMGEVAAAVVAGALSAADGVAVICRRSALLAGIAGQGAMATVGLDRASVELELTGARLNATVSIAVLAGPGSTVVAGATDDVRQLVAAWESRGIPAHLIAVDVASHSPQVEPLLAPLAQCLAQLRPQPPAVQFYSTVSKDPRQLPAFDADYWCANLRRPVRFAAALAAAAADRHTVYLEVAPHPVVTHAINGSLAGLLDSPTVLASLRRDCDDVETFRLQLAAAHCAGVPVDWTASHSAGRLVDVPTMTFDRTSHWLAAVEPDRAPAVAAGWPGTRLDVPGNGQHWRTDAGITAMPWLAEHRVHDEAVLAGAAYAAIATSIGAELFEVPAPAIELAELQFHELLRLAEQVELTSTVTPRGPDRADCTIYSRGEDGGWLRHASATLRTIATADAADQAAAVQVAELAGRHPVPGSADELYAGLRARGVQHGTAFLALAEPCHSEDGSSSWARLAVPGEAAGVAGLAVHPVLIDACAQLLAGRLPAAQDGLILPVRFGRLRLFGDPATAAFCHASVTGFLPDGLTGQVLVYDGSGRKLLELSDVQLRCRRVATAGVERFLLQPQWPAIPRPPAPPVPDGRWLLVDASSGLTALAGELAAAGASPELVTLPAGSQSLDYTRQFIVDRLESASRPAAICYLAGRDDAAEEARRLLAVLQAVTGHYPDPPRLYVLTTGAQALSETERPALVQAGLRGLLRVASFEFPELKMTIVDLDPASAELAEAAAELLAGAADDEVVLRAGRRHVGRLGYAPLTEPERDTATLRRLDSASDGYRLRAAQPGDLGSLEPVAVPRRAPGPDEVQVRMTTAGINFRDVLTAMGMLDEAADRIGFEGVGTISAAGDRVTGLRIGQQVLAIDLRGGAFGSFLTLPASQVRPLPAGSDPELMAGVPACYLTAWYALRQVAGLAAGERVLIHSGTGGTGLAAIAVARALGAQVLATAGSPAKRDYLRGLGIEHVMDSRSLDFTEQTLAATGGDGVDVVLNSLAGPAIQAGLATLRPFGRFIELGVRDILADAPLGMLALQHNISLSSVNLIELQQWRPELFGRLFDELLAEFEAGRLAPLPSRSFELAEATDAFRLMAGAGHLGKLLLRVPASGTVTARMSEPSPVRADGAYLVTGGLRGVGLATARWLSAGGAAHVVLNGRTEPSAGTAAELDELRAAGTRISVVLGDIGEPETARRLVQAATEHGDPLRGVLHSAMVLADAAIGNVTEDQFRRVWRPKVTGAWQLHEAVRHCELDWFVLYSSMASLVGNPGQASYAAANSWLDSFATWRSRLGLPTLTVNWGAWGEIGVATDFADRGYQTIGTADGFAALASLLLHGRVRTGVIPGEPASWIPPAGRASTLFADLFSAGTSNPVPVAAGSQIKAELVAAAAGAARNTVLENYLGAEIRAVLRLGQASLDPLTPLRSLGFDSLLSMELRTRLQNGLGVRLASDFVWTHGTLAALATGLAEHLEVEQAA